MGDAKRRGTYDERKANPTGIKNTTPTLAKQYRARGTEIAKRIVELRERMRGRR